MSLRIRGSCGTCRHFDEGLDQAKSAMDGLCRARSPQVSVIMVPQMNQMTRQTSLTPVVVANFPQVAKDCWCGEWEPMSRLGMNQ